jgi:hypothetical protein
MESWWSRSLGADTVILNALPPSVADLSLKLPYFEDCVGPKILPLKSQHLTSLVLESASWPVWWLLQSAEQCPNVKALTLDLLKMGAN